MSRTHHLARDLSIPESDATFIIDQCIEANKRHWHVQTIQTDENAGSWSLISPTGQRIAFSHNRRELQDIANKLNEREGLGAYSRKPKRVYPPVEDDERYDGCPADVGSNHP